MTPQSSEELMNDLMRGSEWFSLYSMREPRDNELEIIIEVVAPNQSKMGYLPDALKDRSELAFLAKESCPIEPIAGRRKYRLYWKHYAAYLVTEEVVGSCGNQDGESYEGVRVRRYSKSSFLDHLARDTGAHRGPLIHYKMTCLNHLIDVASVDPVEISLVD
jgi:hypothetical protein